MPTIDTSKLPIAGQMAANADEDKKRKFLEGFNKSLGGPSDPPADEQKPMNGGMLSAMKRKMFGG